MSFKLYLSAEYECLLSIFQSETPNLYFNKLTYPNLTSSTGVNSPRLTFKRYWKILHEKSLSFNGILHNQTGLSGWGKNLP